MDISNKTFNTINTYRIGYKKHEGGKDTRGNQMVSICVLSESIVGDGCVMKQQFLRWSYAD